MTRREGRPHTFATSVPHTLVVGGKQASPDVSRGAKRRASGRARHVPDRIVANPSGGRAALGADAGGGPDVPQMSIVELIGRGLAEWALWKTSEASGWLPHRTVSLDGLGGDGGDGVGNDNSIWPHLDVDGQRLCPVNGSAKMSVWVVADGR